MNAEEKVYHERFMREAINMVNHPKHQPAAVTPALLG